MLKQAIAIVVVILILFCAALIVTDLAIKMTRYAIDSNQYGKRYSTITVRDDQAILTSSRDANERVDKYREILNKTGRYATWPNLANFDETWYRSATDESNLPQRSIWYRVKRTENKDEETTRSNATGGNNDTTERSKKRVLIFVHGGATFAGSPHKYNNMHWLKTIGWLGEMDQQRYTDIVSIDYRLRPEFTIDDSIQDCLRSVQVILETGNVEIIHLLGFSAGGMLCLHVASIIEKGIEHYDKLVKCDEQKQEEQQQTTGIVNVSKNNDDKCNKREKLLFNINLNDDAIVRKLCDTTNGLWRQVRRKQLYLIAPLCRLDRLFVNRCYDVSHVLQIFSDTFFEHESNVYDPLFNMIVHGVQLKEFDTIRIVDVCRNSLSNHAISLHEYLRTTLTNDNTSRKLRTIVLDESDMHAKPELLKQIHEYDLRTGRTSNRFVQFELNKLTEVKSSTDEAKKMTIVSSFLVYHFFMYIVPCNASWKTLKQILIDD